MAVSDSARYALGELIMATSGRAPTAVEVRKEERELFFWTVDEVLRAVRKTLLVIVLIALTGYLVVALINGDLPGGELLIRYLGS